MSRLIAIAVVHIVEVVIGMTVTVRSRKEHVPQTARAVPETLVTGKSLHNTKPRRAPSTRLGRGEVSKHHTAGNGELHGVWAANCPHHTHPLTRLATLQAGPVVSALLLRPDRHESKGAPNGEVDGPGLWPRRRSYRYRRVGLTTVGHSRRRTARSRVRYWGALLLPEAWTSFPRPLGTLPLL